MDLSTFQYEPSGTFMTFGGQSPNSTSFNVQSLVGGDISQVGAQALEGGLAAATGGISLAVGEAMKAVIGLDVFAEVGKVLKYGLSSWGASTTPEARQAEFNERVIPVLQNALQSINESNIAQQFSFIHNLLEYNRVHAEHGRQNHARAKSTKLAHEWTMAYCEELKRTVLGKAIKEVEKFGIIVNRKIDRVDYDNPQYFADYVLFSAGAKPDGHKFKMDFATYTIDFSNTVRDEKIQMDANGQVVAPKQASLSTLAFLGLLAVALPKLFKNN